MIAIDTNILIYAHRAENSFHTAANQAIRDLINQGKPCGIPIGCVHEFLAIATNPKVFLHPTPSQHALGQIQAWLDAPSIRLLHSGLSHFKILSNLVNKGHIFGGKMHDARIAATCIENGVSVLWTADRDFSQFTHALKTFNPLIR